MCILLRIGLRSLIVKDTTEQNLAAMVYRKKIHEMLQHYSQLQNKRFKKKDTYVYELLVIFALIEKLSALDGLKCGTIDICV